MLTGGATSTGILVHSQLSKADKHVPLNLTYWRADGTGTARHAGLKRADKNAIVRHVVQGLDPDTAYFGRLLFGDRRIGETIRFTTLPAASGSWSRTIAVVCCQSNASSRLNTDVAWDDVASWQPDDVWHLGDWGYWGGAIPGNASYKEDLGHYVSSMSLQDSMRLAIQAADMNVVTISDHELTDNGDPKGGIHNAPQTIRELLAFQALFPVRTYGDTRDPRRGRYYSFDIGDAVRVIVTDFRSPDRSNATDPDGPDKTMFGSVQLQWIYDQFDTSKVNVLVNETSWLADPNEQPGGKHPDKPWSYYYEQQQIVAHIKQGGYQVVWIGGDRHYIGYLQGTDDGSGVYNTLGEFPCYISSGMSKNQLPLEPGELMNWQFGAGGDVTKPVCQYLRLTLTFDQPSNRVTLSALGRAVLDTSQPMSKWKLENLPGGTATDSWQL